MRRFLAQEGAAALRLRGVEWFAWATGGGSNVVILTTETGIAEILVTRDRAFVLTNPIESLRLREEELTGDYEIVLSPWHEPLAMEQMVRDLTGAGTVYCDRPVHDELPLPSSANAWRTSFGPEEISRYRALGRDAAEAMREAMQVANADWSENRLAAEGAKALWTRGIHPTLVLVAGAERLEKHRHPFPTTSALGRRAMMVFCGRRQGLYANLTRFVAFGRPTPEDERRFRLVAEIENVAFSHSRPGQSLGQMFTVIRDAYAELGLAAEVNQQHFGGTTGYLAREVFARPGEATLIFRDGAVAWNPTLPGTKMEDTALVTETGLEILTHDPRWPNFNLHGRLRPDVLVKI